MERVIEGERMRRRERRRVGDRGRKGENEEEEEREERERERERERRKERMRRRRGRRCVGVPVMLRSCTCMSLQHINIYGTINKEDLRNERIRIFQESDRWTTHTAHNTQHRPLHSPLACFLLMNQSNLYRQ